MGFICRRLITDSKVKLKYQHLITNSFVEVRFSFLLCLLLLGKKGFGNTSIEMKTEMATVGFYAKSSTPQIHLNNVHF